MSSSSTSVIQPTGLVHGHSECRFLDETIPVLTRVLALESDRPVQRSKRCETSQHRLEANPSRRRRRGQRQARAQSLRRARVEQSRSRSRLPISCSPTKKNSVSKKWSSARSATVPTRCFSSNPAATIGKSSPTRTGTRPACRNTSPIPGKPCSRKRTFLAAVMFRRR